MKHFLNRRRLGLATLAIAAASIVGAPAAGANCTVLAVETGEGIAGQGVCALNVWLDHTLGYGGSQCLEFDGHWYFVSVSCGVVAEVTVTVD